ncbi:hypothetical protein BKA93DRAFT_828776 [Sparassis latifolia]|uniref:Uncharacterized protein n=1 Tax=Sparassis crispa TaxID=139825 RepID=A0A401GYW4_9APHY|nr:hypothetical protein SCP_1100300 [Sparassis crispa]GBE87355.1 hypothetical protein SCP_1100300 [Sparassis crispa]
MAGQQVDVNFFVPEEVGAGFEHQLFEPTLSREKWEGKVDQYVMGLTPEDMFLIGGTHDATDNSQLKPRSLKALKKRKAPADVDVNVAKQPPRRRKTSATNLQSVEGTANSERVSQEAQAGPSESQTHL